MSVLQMVFTDLPRGQGVNPSSSGYQIKACSSELTAEQRDWLSAICMHYGDAVYRSAPQKAIDKETAWRARTDNLRSVPAEVLDEFPVATSYTCLDEQHYSLTRVQYTGLTHDGRPGNFQAYALFFHPDELKASRSNPLVAAAETAEQSPLRQVPVQEGAILPALSGLPVEQVQPVNFSILNTEPYAGKLEALISALCSASPKTRPLLLGIQDWRDALPMLQALLELLPPAQRRMTSVCSYESDRNWLPVLRGQRPPGWLAGHHVLVLSGLDQRNPAIRQDEIQNRFAVFNFVHQQFSELGAPRPYAVWAAACVRSGNVRALAGYFDFLEQMGAGHPPEAAASLLDELIPLAAEPGSRRKGGLDTATSPVSAPAQDLVLSSKVLINAARKYQHPEIALEWFSNRIDLLVENQDFTTLGLLGPDITDFLENLSTPASQESGKKLLTKIQELASQTLQQGQVQMAINLCHMTGSGRDAVIVQLLRQVLVGAEQSPLRAEQSSHGKTIKIPELKQRAEQECWLDFLQEGLASNDRLKVQALPRDLLIKAIFQAAVVVGRTDELWSRLGKPVILPYLDEGWNPEKRGLVEQLLKTIPAGASPAAAVELSLRLLQHTSPADPGWLVLARRFASEAKDSPGAETILGDLLKQVLDRFSDKEQKAFTLGILADVVRGAPGGKKIVAAYDESLSSLEHKESLKLRRKLAESGAASILARDLQRDVIPWDPEEGPKRLQRWRDVILDQHPKVLECLRNEVATRLQRSEQGDAFVPLALELLPREAGGAAGQAAPGAPHPGAPRPATQDVLALWDGLLLRLPLIPGSLPAGAPRLPRPPANLSPESSQRVRIIQLLAEIQQSARAENWSLADFPSTQPAWAQDVHALNPKEKREVWLWCLGTFTKTGITLSAHAGGLVQALEAIGERAWLSDSVANLLQGRDPVTCILAFTAFVDKGIGSHRPAEWGRYLGEIMARTDKAEQDRLRTVFRLFEEHLLKRFSPKNKGYQEKLVILAEEAGLAVVVKSIRSQFDAVVEKPAGSAKPAGSEGTAAASRETAAPMPGVNDAGKAQDRTQEQAKGPSIVEAPKVAGERLSGTFKRLFGKKDSSTTQDEDIRSKDVPRQEE